MQTHTPPERHNAITQPSPAYTHNLEAHKQMCWSVHPLNAYKHAETHSLLFVSHVQTQRLKVTTPTQQKLTALIFIAKAGILHAFI